jgi:hypothetical protein
MRIDESRRENRAAHVQHAPRVTAGGQPGLSNCLDEPVPDAHLAAIPGVSRPIDDPGVHHQDVEILPGASRSFAATRRVCRSEASAKEKDCYENVLQVFQGTIPLPQERLELAMTIFSRSEAHGKVRQRLGGRRGGSAKKVGASQKRFWKAPWGSCGLIYPNALNGY